jgi:electron transfer flavoprotein alpha subunit
MAEGIWFVAEQRDGNMRKVTYEAASAAKKLADQAGQSVTALVLGGAGIGAQAEELGGYGADKVVVVEDDAVKDYLPRPYAMVMAKIIEEHQPAMVILPASIQGKYMASALAGRLGVAVAMDCIELELDDNKQLVAKRPIYAGKAHLMVKPTGQPQIATTRPNVFPAVEPDASKKAEVVKVDLPVDASEFKTALVDIQKDASGKIELTEADIIVSGGRGMKGPENYDILEEMAGVLGAAVGASRSAVDAGWRPHTDQVGQTGKVVSPNLYIACGISGAIQHLAGMGSSKVITAINKDPEAPIFQKADYGVVADLFDVVPAMTEELKKVKQENE